jgi:hypothetical protein
MADARGGQPSGDQTAKPARGDAVALTAPPPHPPPGPADGIPKGVQCRAVHGHAVVPDVTSPWAAFLQFGSFSMALLVAGASLAIATVLGTLITTWMTGKNTKMNAAAVFISLLFWVSLWGIWGLLLSIPIIVIVKVVSQHVERLQQVAEFLGE